MKLNIKKMYQDTIHTLEKHQLEVQIAIAALTIIAAAAFSTNAKSMEEENEVKAELRKHLEAVLAVITAQLDALKAVMHK